MFWIPLIEKAGFPEGHTRLQLPRKRNKATNGKLDPDTFLPAGWEQVEHHGPKPLTLCLPGFGVLF